MSDREKWLNGWPRMGSSVLIGSAVHCAGCGAYGGITCVVIPDDWQDPEKLPDWPFEQSQCPICEILQHKKEHRTQPTPLVDRLATFKAARTALLQEAISLIDEARGQPDDLQGEIDDKIAAFKARLAAKASDAP